jgi:2-hydroxy-6-oxonona-2,4-dienedioate hydrolase
VSTPSAPYQPRSRPGEAWPARAYPRRTQLPDGTPMHGWHLERPGAPAVVLVHGLGAASDALVPIATVLAGRFSVHLPDLPGYGRTPHERDDLGPPELADALADWVRALPLGPAAFVGNSAGCQTLVHLAVRHHNLVDRLVLQGPTTDPEARTRRQQAARLWFDGTLEHPTLTAVQFVGARQAGTRRLRRSFRRLLEDRPEDLLSEVTHPVLVVRGNRDPVVPQRWAERVAELAPDDQLATVPGGAHTLVYSRPRQLAPVIRSFLAATPPHPDPDPTTEQEEHP